MRDFVLEQELPDPETAFKQAEESLQNQTRRNDCPHLLEVFPHHLSLDQIRTPSGRVTLANPVHALHLASQTDPSGEPESDSWWYGLEQERSVAVQTPGIHEFWHAGIRETKSNLPLLMDAKVSTGTTSAPPHSSTTLPPFKQHVGSAPEVAVAPPLPLSSDAGTLASLTNTNQNAVYTYTPDTDPRFNQWSAQEALIRDYRNAIASPSNGISSKRLKLSNVVAKENCQDNAHKVTFTTHLWMENYRISRERYWLEKSNKPITPAFGAIDPVPPKKQRCQLCHDQSFQSCNAWRLSTPEVDSTVAGNDNLMQCLDCGVLACHGTAKHIWQHFIVSRHNFAVHCDNDAKLYCFACGDFVQHEVFTLEKSRIDIAHTLPFLAWPAAPLQRSFDAMQFMRIDQSIFWQGMIATYPPSVPVVHVQAAQASYLRYALVHGNVCEIPPNVGQDARRFVILQSKKAASNRWRLSAPVGMYNLGNSCYQSAVLQCLINCIPLQKYFLRDVGHHSKACLAYRTFLGKEHGDSVESSVDVSVRTPKSSGICIACELDRLMLNYLGSTVGEDMEVLFANVSGDSEMNALDLNSSSRIEERRGQPLVTAEILTANWKCGAMDHLAGYEQQDAHEFFHAFIDILGKHVKRFRDQVDGLLRESKIFSATQSTAQSPSDDFIKNLFEGNLRSVLVCQLCGSKRSQSEKFMSLSLPLSKEVHSATSELPGESSDMTRKVNLSVERCLRHFALPEMLSDPVDCPACGKKTPTKKQHVVSRLPRILVLHLKRFDAAHNRKIEDFVSFPAQNLNMGPFLPHWCEVTRGSIDRDENGVEAPEVFYNLFATVNHFGTINSGHYVANVKVDRTWYHANDAWVGHAGITDGEAEVLRSNAYLLFYMRT